MLEESEDIHNDLEAMTEKLQYLDSVYHASNVSASGMGGLDGETEELRQVIKITVYKSPWCCQGKKKKKKKGYLNGKLYIV